MSLLIKGMDLPEISRSNGLSVKRQVFVAQIVVEEHNAPRIYVHFGNKIADFELAAIPTPHGDLIDRDILNECCESVINEPPTVAAICIAASIGQATPVIEAEGQQ